MTSAAGSQRRRAREAPVWQRAADRGGRDRDGRLAIALIAHDRLKPAFVAWVYRHEPALRRHTLFATGTTGAQLQKACPRLSLQRLRSGPEGGDQQIGAMIAEGRIDALFFFNDPMTPMPHDVDVKALFRLSTLHNVPMACNEATADLVLRGLCYPADGD